MDATESGTPAAGGQLSGEITRNAAIKRQKKLQQNPSAFNPLAHVGAGGPPGAVPVPKS